MSKSSATNHTKTHNHNHDHDHQASHNHGKLPVILYLIGLVLFFLALLVGDRQLLLSNILYTLSIASAGYHVIGEGVMDTIKDSKDQGRFAPNVHLLMSLATFGAMIIGNFSEGALLILIFAGAHFLEDYAYDRSKREVSRLLNMNPSQARLIQADGSTQLVDVADLNIGDQVQVLNGDQIPIDGEITSGQAVIDESAINGESIPREKAIGDQVFAGTINGSQAFKMKVTTNPEATVLAQIMDMVKNAQTSQSKTATLIKKLEPRYVTLALIMVPLVFIFGHYAIGWTWEYSFYRTMVFLISVSPCALAAAALPTSLSAISNLARYGVLVKGANYLSHLAGLKAVAFDKTGTLTTGKPQVTDYDFKADLDQEEILAIVVGMEKGANHPLATAIVERFADQVASPDITAHNETGIGLVADYQGHRYRIGKPTSFTEELAVVSDLQGQGKTVVLVGRDDQVLGYIALMDLPTDVAKAAINYFKDQDVHTAMLTGDSQLTGQSVGQELGLDQVDANILPEEKADHIKALQDQHGLTAMLGDGVNDAPALVTADVGVAMGEGTDVAIDVADLVLMKNDLSKLVYAHKVARKMERVTWQNIIFAMFVVVVLVTLNFLEMTDITLGVILHEGSTLMVILNGLRLLLPVRK
ncbi:metal-transporting ATPase [Aerococcus urinaehominis]|uniref:Metal-transporting ATPase n=1 Tax=Aerococcus urinaehominis TaxID=128944 RepID=A0A109RGS9_9LACT|nr:heavy metal translocating P-type ATPase [Aerococcus urinaehominis]AMB99309.1 metal-transporting ATPase [Aerococcus urinaehominis]SDM19771.1 Cd2+/Zn2+-exporting ATPase [Aerococcus urinaehominis]